MKQPDPVPTEACAGNAELRNFTVVHQQLALEIARREITLHRASHYPNVDLVANRSDNNQRNTQQNLNNNGPTNAVAVRWNISLFSCFAVTSRILEAIALEESARRSGNGALYPCAKCTSGVSRRE